MAATAGASLPIVREYQRGRRQSTASGRAIALEETSEVRLADGRTAVLLSYRSDVDLEDRGALQDEVDAVWEHFRPAVEAAGRGRAVVRARRLDKPGWERRIQIVQFVVERAPGGGWRARNGDESWGSR